MKKILIFLGSIIFLASSCAVNKKQTKTEVNTLNSTIDSLSYCIGINIGQTIKKENFESFSREMLYKAIDDVLLERGELISEAEANKFMFKYISEKKQKQADKAIEESKNFLEKNKQKEGVVVLPSGLQYRIIKKGNGQKPKETDVVKTHYHGTLPDGKVFDSSVDRGEPAVFAVNRVIKGWTEALQLMPVGSKWELVIPPELAYGERGAGSSIGPNQVLIFEVELLSIEEEEK